MRTEYAARIEGTETVSKQTQSHPPSTPDNSDARRREVAREHGRERRSPSEYVERRNGVPLGSPGSLRGVLRRSLGADTLGGFWRHWNPIWGYYLGRYVNAPLRRVMPSGVSVVGRNPAVRSAVCQRCSAVQGHSVPFMPPSPRVGAGVMRDRLGFKGMSIRVTW